METLSAAWADVYDAIYSYVREDIPFYVQEAQKDGGLVLELGCGTGRITLPIAESGVNIVGMDSSDPMLEVARRKLVDMSDGIDKVTFVHGDMTSIPKNYYGKFSLVIVPFRGFLSLITTADQENTLNSIRLSLAPGGRLVFDVFVPDLDMLVQESDTAYHLRDVTDPKTRDRLVVWHQGGYDNHNQIIYVRLIVDRLSADGVVTKRTYQDYQIRYSHRWEIYNLLLRCGFEILDLLGDFDCSEFDETSRDMIWVARPST